MKTTKLILVITAICLLSSCSTATKNDLEQDKQPSKQQDKELKITLKQECEESGSDDSNQCKLYHSDLAKDEKESQLGIMYFSGYGSVPKDCERSKYWLTKATKAENSDALNQLGVFYYVGCRTTQHLDNDFKVQTFELDFKSAEKYFLLANKKGHKQAKANLGSIYSDGGYGIEQSNEKAIEWFTKAIEDTPARAYDGLSVVYGRQQKYAEALPCVKKGAEAGSSQAQNNLGYFYENGLGGLDVDKQKALEWYKKSADQGFARAQSNFERLQTELGQ